MYGFYYPFNNPRFRNPQNSYCVFEACSHLFVSSDMLECRLLKLLLDHPMNSEPSACMSRFASRQVADPREPGVDLRSTLHPPPSTLHPHGHFKIMMRRRKYKLKIHILKITNNDKFNQTTGASAVCRNPSPFPPPRAAYLLPSSSWPPLSSPPCIDGIDADGM